MSFHEILSIMGMNAKEHPELTHQEESVRPHLHMMVVTVESLTAAIHMIH